MCGGSCARVIGVVHILHGAVALLVSATLIYSGAVE